jgi:tetratricopeptide (TPR) repeat protein
MERGNRFHSEGKYKEAIIEYKNVLHLDGNNIDARRKLALSYYAIEDFVEALDHFEKARDANPDDLDVRLKLAQCCIYLGKPVEARNELNFILDKDSQRLDALDLLADAVSAPDQISDMFIRLDYVNVDVDPQRFNLALGLLYAKKGDLPKAENYLFESLKGEAKLPEADLALGSIAAARKDLKLAEQEFRTAVEGAPENFEAHLSLADFYLLTKSPDQARTVLENLIQKSPAFPPALQRLARIALENGKLDECDKYLRAALSKNPSDLEAKLIDAQLLLARNDTNRAEEELEEVIRTLPEAAMPRYLLGLAYMRGGNVLKAKAHVQRAVDLAPDFMPAVLLLATVNEQTGAHERAVESMFKVIGKDSGNLQAFILLSETVKTSNEIEKAEKLLERSAIFLKDNPKFCLAQGIVFFKKGDLAKAEFAINEALAREPDFVDAHVLLGDCLLRTKDQDRAGQEYEKAVEFSPNASMAHIKLAEFYLKDGKPDEAKRVLLESAAKSPEFLPASFSLAKIAFMERDFDQSIRLLDTILQKNPNYVEALTLRGQVKLARYKTTEALEDLRQALKINPDSEDALNLTGIAYLRESNFAEARSCFSGLVRFNPDLYLPRVLLAELDIRQGEFQSAIYNLEFLLEKGGKDPVIYLLLGSAYLGNKDFLKAGAALRNYLGRNPGDPHGNFLYGLALSGQGKQTEAVRYFEDALNASPPIKDALAQLVSIDIARKDPDSALNRISTQIETAGDDAQAYLLLGDVRQMRGEMDQADAAYLRAIQIDPKLIPAYMKLARLRVTAKNYEKALVMLDQVIKLDPKNVGALILSGTLHQKMNDIPRAQEEYEKVLDLKPGFAQAANNLAYIYSEFVGDNDKALRLAKIARKSAPDDPNVADTIGWVLYKGKDFETALTYLKESAAKLPDNAEIQYHLGMAQYKLGNYHEAEQTLKNILKKGGDFKGAGEARLALDEMMKQ